MARRSLMSWQMLVLSLCCGCGLDTAPEGRGARDAGAGLQPVSFGAWQRLLGRAPSGAAGAGDLDAGPREPAGRDASACDTCAPDAPARDAERASPRPPAAIGGSGGGGTGADRAAHGGAGGASADHAADSSTGSAAGAAGARDARETPPAPDTPDAGAPDASATPPDAGRPDPTGDPASASLDAGRTDPTGETATGATTVSEGEAPAPDAEGHAARVAQRVRLLGLVQTTVDNAFGLIWTSESSDITSAAAALAAGPEDAITRPAVADLLIRLSRTSGCRSDNPRECAELCAALESDCTVCRTDDTCQASVEHMCAPQSHFQCSP